ncbi:uncharacterized protein LOC123672092 [Harmonia axyridis]|uniref:uncharacterized protein LOC123672092 n=1 Tax=Harmonia axyridis TaxID=115357 RepID=UPI001E277EC0|nr:uncharacterized protein LOC123672092 [Harmonia axyridis]
MDITKLKQRRGQIEEKLSRFETYINSIETSELDELTITQLEIRLSKIEPIYDKFNELQSEIEENTVEDRDDVSNISEQFEDLYFNVVSYCKKMITQFNKRDMRSFGISQPNSHFQGSQQVKLPTIKLPTFNGSIENWLEFKDAFIALVQDNDNLADIQKFYYLKSSLEHEPAQLISSVQVCASNYPVAWSLLTDRYENKKLIINNYIKALFDVKPVIKENSAGLRNVYDEINKNLKALETLGQPVNHWDSLIIYILSSKFDSVTKREWESFKHNGDLPTMVDMQTFLKTKCELLERLNNSSDNSSPFNKYDSKTGFNNANKSKPFLIKQKGSTLTSSVRFSCYYCNQGHAIYNCDSFKSLSLEDRISAVTKAKLCHNCLSSKHITNECQKSNCRKCKGKHNTLLHKESLKSQVSTSTVSQDSTSETAIAPSVLAAASNNPSFSETKENRTVLVGQTNEGEERAQCLLSTAVILVADANGCKHSVRALLDAGSQTNFITSDLCKRLNLNTQPIKFAISGVGEAMSEIHSKVQVSIFSRLNNYNESISCLIIPKITQNLPIVSFDIDTLQVPTDINLADPNLNRRGKIEMLIGCELFYNLLLMQQLKRKGLPTLQNTRFGWIVGGQVGVRNQHKAVVCHISVEEQMCNAVKRFWQIDELEIAKNDLLNDSEFCNKHFIENYKRDPEGRFIVKIPFKPNHSELSNTRQLAINRFHSLERKLIKYPNLKEEYTKFIREYIQLGHMKLIQDTKDEKYGFYLPHHAVVKEDSLTTKVRVVFDGSAKSDQGLSLNEAQYSGPVIQSDLFSVLMRFRRHTFVLSGDVSKMFRQVLIAPEHRRFQKIFWRFDSTEELRCYELQTVTYGMTSAGFLAVRSMLQLALDFKEKYPVACEAILSDFYMDDFLSGADDVEQLLQLQREVSIILASGGFQLRKWMSNRQHILNEFHVNADIDVGVLHLGENEQSKMLGLCWNSIQDSIQFSSKHFREFKRNNVTKRSILANVSQIFDPLGLLGPLTINAKIIIQRLWVDKVEWDQTVSKSIYEKWIRFCEDLQHLNKISIPRYVLSPEAEIIELHGFSDASEAAYGACVYVRYKNKNVKGYHLRLLCAKSRVAPIKQVTLPRLELMAAVLLVELQEKVRQALKIKFDRFHFWTDSMITLCWIQSTPKRWNTFVANRVSKIQSSTEIQDWHYIKSKDNPADLISRGVNINQLIDSRFWWNGPPYLSEDSDLPTTGISMRNEMIPEQRILVNMATTSRQPTFEIFDRFSTFSKLKRVVAYCLRFFHNSKLTAEKRVVGVLTIEELETASKVLIKLAQQQSFEREIVDLKAARTISSSSPLLRLNPFLDEKGIMRVGGRLQNAENLSFNKKHPILLHNKHKLTEIILIEEHKRLLHCGPQQLLYSIREEFWPLSGRNLVRAIVYKCVTCFKAKPRAFQYVMGNLPVSRVNEYLPFFNTGLDFCGHFMIKDRKTRNYKTLKAYVCVFVCMTTKALHLELVTSLTSEAFLAVFKRFVARRGRPLHLFSDNGTTFIGANSEIQSFLKKNNAKISDSLAKDNITWHFMPPRAPNFGGLWESGVRSFKFHLKRVINNTILDYEEFSTVLAQIESVLNSRPISPLSSSPNDFNPLTPGHFLIGRAITAIPEQDFLQIPENRLKRFQHLQRIIQHYWKRWNNEYITHLQDRVKWHKRSKELLQIGSLVVIKEENNPVNSWKIGRITALHPGNDGVVRVVSLKCSGNGAEFKRPVSKICVLPVE